MWIIRLTHHEKNTLDNIYIYMLVWILTIQGDVALDLLPGL